ncbi:MAG: type I 3-dehydroquinate dehydratase [Myxococcales bacterium]|nr:type I 3-dehydroquinate dehydratase [Myxococcales bacterium]
MWCITGNERSLAAIEQRLADTEARLKGGVLHELRLDLLERLDDEVFAFIAAHAARLVVACRPVRQGGAFQDGEGERLAILRRAASLGPRWLDVEGDVGEAELAPIRALTGARLLLSWHDFSGASMDGPVELAARVRALADKRPGALKVAVMVHDACEIVPLVEAVRAAGLPFVAIAMGAAGLLSRTHYARLGSAFTYVAADDATRTAEGQLSVDEALAMGLLESAGAPLFALVGGAQLADSPGPRVYNALFRRRGIASSYVPVVTGSLAAVLPLLERLDLRGLSVTMPLKLEALGLSEPDELAREVGAVNSMRTDDGRWQGTNTDVAGVSEALAHEPRMAGVDRMLILGAGGAARAAAMAGRKLGLAVSVCARRVSSARELTQNGGDAHAWDERHELGRRAEIEGLADRTVLVNATPLATAESAWPRDAPLPARIVFDLALGTRAFARGADAHAVGANASALDAGETALGANASALGARARSEGKTAIAPLAMWLAQGAAQMSWFLREPVTADELAELLA